jgi:hypothetical protein
MWNGAAKVAESETGLDTDPAPALHSAWLDSIIAHFFQSVKG